MASYSENMKSLLTGLGLLSVPEFLHVLNSHFKLNYIIVITGDWYDRFCLDMVTDEKQSRVPGWGLNLGP